MEHESLNGSESDECVIDDTDYVHEAEQVVYDCSQISIENALILNKQMRVYLNDLKLELERMLQMCQDKYKENELLLTEMKMTKNEPKIYTTYYFCGYPFFKDRKGGAPPKSAEYLRRSELESEIFPLDLEKRSVWVPRDKLQLVQGVKKQVIDHLRIQSQTKLRQTVSKRLTNERLARTRKDAEVLENMHLKDLLEKATGFHINWNNISMDAMDDRHSPNECQAMWFGYLVPTLNRMPWTPDEEDKLLNAALKYGAQNWNEIANAVENRSVYQCFVHYQTNFSNKFMQKNTKWSDEEDKQLIAYVKKYRIGNIIPWTKVMENFPGRTKLQIYNRYMYTLNPEINHEPFTIEEDCILMAAIKEYGINYREFPTNLLPGRSMRQIRSRYNNVLKHVNKREHWTEKHDRKLMELIERHGTTDWVKIADAMVSHSRTSCRQRYTTIRKFLDKNPGKTISHVPRRKRAFSTNVTTENWMETIIEAKNFESIDSDIDGSTSSQSNQKKTLKTSQSTIAKSLHSVQYFDYFKYSFNFKLGETVIGSESLFENIQIACQLLQAQKIPPQIDITNPWFSAYVMNNNAKKVQLEPDLLRSLHELGKNDFLYPINLNTILGMRGLTIMFETIGKKKSHDNDGEIKIETNETANELHDSLKLFKARFKSIFKQSATIAQLQRNVTSVSLRLRTQKLRSSAEIPTTSTGDSDNNRTLQHSLTSSSSSYQNVNYIDSEELTVSESEEPPRKRLCVTILENKLISMPQVSTSSRITGYRYRVESTKNVEGVQIQPYVSESDTDNYETDFVIWTPTVTDESTGSTTIRSYKSNQ